MAELPKEEIPKIAGLARLSLTDVEVSLYQERLARVLDHIDELKSVPTEKGMVRHIPKDVQAFHADKIQPFSERHVLLENAPQVEAHCFVLPPIKEQS